MSAFLGTELKFRRIDFKKRFLGLDFSGSFRKPPAYGKPFRNICRYERVLENLAHTTGVDGSDSNPSFKPEFELRPVAFAAVSRDPASAPPADGTLRCNISLCAS